MYSRMELIGIIAVPWTSQMTNKKLDMNEKRAFLEWHRNITRLAQVSFGSINGFIEKNVDIGNSK